MGSIQRRKMVMFGRFGEGMHFLVLINSSSGSMSQMEEIMNPFCYEAEEGKNEREGAMNRCAKYDAYDLRGTWNRLFLVPTSCDNSKNAIETEDTPEGYRWVSFAKKQDIAWDEMMKIEGSFTPRYLFAYIQAGEWHSIYEGVGNECEEMKWEAWEKEVKTYINSLNQEEYLLGIDCHAFGDII